MKTRVHPSEWSFIILIGGYIAIAAKVRFFAPREAILAECNSKRPHPRTSVPLPGPSPARTFPCRDLYTSRLTCPGGIGYATLENAWQATKFTISRSVAAGHEPHTITRIREVAGNFYPKGTHAMQNSKSVLAKKGETPMVVSIKRSRWSWMRGPRRGNTGTGFVMTAAVLYLISAAQAAIAEEFWVTPIARGKGDDYLIIEDLKKPVDQNAKKPPARPRRRLRCVTSLPVYIGEMARAAKRINSELLLRVEVRVTQPVVGGEMAELLAIKMVVLTPRSNCPSLQRLGKLPEKLPEEKVLDVSPLIPPVPSGAASGRDEEDNAPPGCEEGDSAREFEVQE